MVYQFDKEFFSFLIKLNIHLPHDPTTPFLGFYSREIKAYVHTKAYTREVTAALS